MFADPAHPLYVGGAPVLPGPVVVQTPAVPVQPPPVVQKPGHTQAQPTFNFDALLADIKTF